MGETDEYRYSLHVYPITGVNRSIISGVMSGASLFHGFKYTGVQEYQMSGNNIIIMPSPRKSDSHDAYSTGITGGSVRLRVAMSSQCTCTT